MTDSLTPSVRAVYDAFNRIGLYNEPSFKTDRKALAAALRAIVDQVAPEHYFCCTGHGEFDFGMEARNETVREAILDIATELESV